MWQHVHVQDFSQADVNQAVQDAPATSSTPAVKKNKVQSVDVNELIIKGGLKPMGKGTEPLQDAVSVSPNQPIESKDVAEPKERQDDVNVAPRTHGKNEEVRIKPVNEQDGTVDMETKTPLNNKVNLAPIRKTKKSNVEIKQLEKKKIKNPTPFRELNEGK